MFKSSDTKKVLKKFGKDAEKTYRTVSKDLAKRFSKIKTAATR